MDDRQNGQTAASVQKELQLILDENTRLAGRLDYSPLGPMIDAIQKAGSVFLIASGRSGYSLRSAAMRLMHLGLQVSFVGDTTTPAIKAGDLLIAASGSGTTSTVVRAAEKAIQMGAAVIAMTTNPASPLARLATIHLLIPAAEKQDHGGEKSRQYAGSLFEQSLLLLTDAIFMTLWKMQATPAEELWKRHANME